MTAPLYDPNAETVIAGDIGGTQIRAAVVERSGNVLTRDAIDTIPERGIDDASRRLAAMAVDLCATAGSRTVAGMGVSTAGPLDPDSGRYVDPPNLTGWDGQTMKPALEATLGIPVWIGHDATLAAFAETRFGPHRGARNLLYVTVSTGVGGGIIANGEMVTGRHGYAGEVGHMTVRPGGQSCNVGCDGCFEGNASGPSIVRSAIEAAGAGSESLILKFARGDPAKVTSRIVFEAADRGDAVATRIRQDVIETIGVGFGSLLNIFDPEALVAGGGVMNGLKPQWDEVLDAVGRHSLAVHRAAPPVHLTTHGDDVSLLGAAALAFRNSAAQSSFSD